MKLSITGRRTRQTAAWLCAGLLLTGGALGGATALTQLVLYCELPDGYPRSYRDQVRVGIAPADELPPEPLQAAQALAGRAETGVEASMTYALEPGDYRVAVFWNFPQRTSVSGGEIHYGRVAVSTALVEVTGAQPGAPEIVVLSLENSVVGLIKR